MKKEEVVHVSVKVRAIEVGHYGGAIVPVGTEFVYRGGLNRRGGLPLWVEALEEWEAPKKDGEEVVAAPVAPVLPALASAEAPKKGGKKAKVSLSDSVA